MTDKPKLTVRVGEYSSVVGGGVHLHEADGRFAGQIMIACQTDTLRDKYLQKAMCSCIAKALTQFFAAGQAGTNDDLDELGTCEGCSMKILQGEPHHYSDGVYLCEDCAPMASDGLKQMDEALRDGDWEIFYGDVFAVEGDLRAYRDGLAARIAETGDYKLVTRGQA